MNNLSSWCSIAIIAWFLAGCGGGSTPVPPPPAPAVTISDVGEYLATARCPDGMPAIIEGCTGAPQRASDPMHYRMADRSGHTDGQLSDGFVGDPGNYYVQSFSYPPNGPFVASHGDGGDAMVIDGGASMRVDYTQNGTPGGGTIAGYWAGANCPPFGTGWLLFDNKAPTGSWRSQVAYLAASATRGACPYLNPGFTRWRKESAAVSFDVLGAPKVVTLPIVVSEHYDNATIASSEYMERVIMARGVGRVLWQTLSRAGPAVSYGNPGLSPWADAPAGWNVIDERVLTKIVPGNGMTGAQFAWPGAGWLP